MYKNNASFNPFAIEHKPLRVLTFFWGLDMLEIPKMVFWA